MQQNTQEIEKRVVGMGMDLAVNSIFHTIQGEGPFAGQPAMFIRLAGCNLQCPLCDTEYSLRRSMEVGEIVEHLYNESLYGYAQPKLVVITGGEPFRQPIGRLIKALLMAGYKVQIETNGTLFQDDWSYCDPNLTIVCSPKTGAVNKRLQPLIKAYKYVATAGSILGSPDGLPIHALEHPNSGKVARPHEGFTGPVYLQAVDEKRTDWNRKNLEAVVRSCLKHGHTLCIQIHKLIGVD